MTAEDAAPLIAAMRAYRDNLRAKGQPGKASAVDHCVQLVKHHTEKGKRELVRQVAAAAQSEVR